jgi:hypothetical protein
MSVNHELEREFREIEGTKFWTKFIKSILERRGLMTRNLERDGTIGKPCVHGEIWQSNILAYDAILQMPRKIIGFEDNPEGTS